MKKTCIILALLLVGSGLFAQNDSSKIEQYCQLIITPRLFSNKVTVDIDLGEEKSFWADTRLRTFDGKLKKFNTIIDALNFMGREGWIFINAYPVRMGTGDIYHYGFRKVFLRSELKEY
jgi:hypothetical protein